MNIRSLLLLLAEEVARELLSCLTAKLLPRKCTADNLIALMHDEVIPLHIRQAVARDVLMKYGRTSLVLCDDPKTRTWN